jgi:hypothetical protein
LSFRLNILLCDLCARLRRRPLQNLRSYNDPASSPEKPQA